ncbi:MULTISPECIES: hypothetical protein [unclassified Wolbachia]|uniref:hypothetical protein n=1 Tax=unclassified Wolbachia TaxID=2640676 RepID=UPI001AE27B4D|nr:MULTISPECIES: hypothetical protein [unclassified Wolbachia]MDX5496160.1 hypothetical protein [Wolbachia endosymbiont of Nomada fabriciana]MDX5507009.1 hypothetical protein [Wolbachia endosymbiont of Hylaeus sinuatus]MDX5528434.1 hypothetical protein [Wolbachia endosymbiont of Andrena minutula]QTP61403.1 hypothetical protein HUB92_06150 [Wolbachia endosymbiont of Wiebesia pumilae]
MSGSQQPPSPVIQVAPYGVIPVPRHWDPGKLIVHYSNIFDQKLDSSVKHWNDTLPMGTALKLQQHE